MSMEEQADRQTEQEQLIYFNMLAEIGHTKHIGGQMATARLVELIAPEAMDQVLDVGCGVGIAPVFLAQQFGCHVTGVDITPRMIERAQERAQRHGVSRLVDLRVADMHTLPFEENSFDSAMAESVLTFSDDKLHVVNELARVVRPGGMVAFTEAIWVQEPPDGKREFMARAAGMPQGILTNEDWQAILEDSRLDELVAEAHAITAREESKSQAGRAGLGDYLRAIPGFLRAMTKSENRQVLRTAAGSVPRDLYSYVGYGIYGGRAGDNN